MTKGLVNVNIENLNKQDLASFFAVTLFMSNPFVLVFTFVIGLFWL